MKILLHSCCGPCTIFPLKVLRSEQHDLTGFFHNPNIHPFREFSRRLDTLREFAETVSLPLLVNETYGLRDYLQFVDYSTSDRCHDCYRLRLEKAASFAKTNNFDAFSTTLLYSRFQNHEAIKAMCTSLAVLYELQFVYHDFRLGWHSGIEESKTLGMYRQPYCGCIFSEQERYDKSFRKNKKKSEQC